MGRGATQFLAMLVPFVFGPAAAARAEGLEHVRTIVIDPGHGGQDVGAVGAAQVYEKELTLAVSLMLRDRLALAYPELAIALTRDSDVYPTLDERTHLANQLDADLFISIHFNTAPNLAAVGVETYYISPEGTSPGELVPGAPARGPAEPDAPVGADGQVQASVVSDLRRLGAQWESARLAELVQAEACGAMGAVDRHVRQEQFRVLRGAFSPSIVVELGFLTNEDEGRRVLELDYQMKMVDGLFAAIVAYDAALDLVVGDDADERIDDSAAPVLSEMEAAPAAETAAAVGHVAQQTDANAAAAAAFRASLGASLASFAPGAGLQTASSSDSTQKIEKATP